MTAPNGAVENRQLVYFRFKGDPQRVQHFDDHGVNWARSRSYAGDLSATHDSYGWEAEWWRK